MFPGLGAGKCHTGDGGAVYAESTEVVEANLGIWRGGFNAESAEGAKHLLGAEYPRASVLERSEFAAPVTGRARRKRSSPYGLAVGRGYPVVYNLNV